MACCLAWQGPSLRFQLPSEPNTYVDLVDDEDVKLMFDEWADYVAGGRHAAAKLHIFVDWQQPQPRASSRDSALLTNHRASTGSIDGRLGSVPEGRPMQSPNVSGGSPGFPGLLRLPGLGIALAPVCSSGAGLGRRCSQRSALALLCLLALAPSMAWGAWRWAVAIHDPRAMLCWSNLAIAGCRPHPA